MSMMENDPSSYLDKLRDIRQQIKDLKDQEIMIIETLAVQYAEKLTGQTGTVNIDGIKFHIPKNVKWDQAKLAEVWLDIEAAGQDPFEYMSVTRDVSEARYKAWPADIRAAFEPARTVNTGKVTIKLED